MTLQDGIHPTRALRAVRARCAALCAALLLGTLAACGGGGGDGGSPPPGPGPGGTSGAWYYTSAGKAVRFDLASAGESAVALTSKSLEQIGYGNGAFTDVEQDNSSNPIAFTINLRRSTPPPFNLTRALPAFEVMGGRISGPVQPAPSAALYAMHTLQSAGLGEPSLDYAYVIDETLKVLVQVNDVRDPVWLGNDRIVVAGADGLFTVPTVESNAPVLTRIGPVGLGQASVAPERPAVSPDGRSIAFVQGAAVWRINVDGTGLAQVTLPQVGQTWPAWSPDGTRLAVLRHECPPVGTGQPEPDVVLVSATGVGQNLDGAATVARSSTSTPVRTCGPLVWLAQ
jgi:WD40-like Beta Propeller Repeat